MNSSKSIVSSVALALTFSAAHLMAADMGGRVDFGSFSPPSSGGEFVEVNIGATLISMAARLVEKEEPEVAKMIAGLRSIRVNVIGLDDENRGELKDRAKKLQKKLADGGWERVVAAQQKGQDVAVYLKSRANDIIQGLTVTVMEGEKHAVFINVDGDLKPDQLSELGERMDIEPLRDLKIQRRNRQEAEEEN